MIDEQLGMQPLMETSTNPKELFDVSNIEAKTELTSEQVMIVARIKILAKRLKDKYGLDETELLINHFLKLQISKDRKSREEFVSSFQSKNDERVGGMLDKFNMNLGK